MESKKAAKPSAKMTSDKCRWADDVLSGYQFEEQPPTPSEGLLELRHIPSFYSDQSLNPTSVPIHFKPSQYNLTELYEIRLADQHVVYDLSANLPNISRIKSDYQLTEMK